MIKIYTPKEWNAFFSSPSLIIDGEYIYSADDYQKIIGGMAIGKIDYEKGYIYGQDWMKIGSRPIARVRQEKEEIRIYKMPEGFFDQPILYIKNGKVYDPEGYYSFFGSPSGYVKEDDQPGSGGGSAFDFGDLFGSKEKQPGGQNGGHPGAFSGGDAGSSDSEFGCLGQLVGSLALAAGLIVLICSLIYYVITETASQVYSMATNVPLLLVMIVMVIVLSVNLKKTFGKVHNPSAKMKQQCGRAALGVALKAMIVPLAVAVLGVLIAGVPEMIAVSIPFLALMFVYCWVVVRRMMLAGLVGMNGKSFIKKETKQVWKSRGAKAGGIFGKLKAGKKKKPAAPAGVSASGKVVRPCPKCAARCAVPAGRGEITITCPMCRTKYKART